MVARRTGWRKSPPKVLGAKPDFKAVDILPPGPPPVSASNLQQIVSILDQLEHESCTANAAAQLLRADMVRQGYVPAVLPSRDWFWYLARAQDGSQKLDTGTWNRAIFDVAKKLGYPAESLWPYDDGPVEGPNGPEPRWAAMPDSAAFRAAHDQRDVLGVAYYRITETGDARIEVVQRALAAGHCVQFGTLVTDAFMSGPTSVIHVTSAPAVGGHAMLWVGYDSSGVDVCNSWSDEWGMSGFCRMGWDYVAWSQTDDLWIALHAPKLGKAA